jgi:glycosyltransferase involved in cell wall biosynthesis
VERNGLDLAVEALRQVRPLIKNAELRIYGRRTPFLDRIFEDVRNSGLEDAVRYLGPKCLEDLVVEIERCDVGVIPNHNNPFTQINTPVRIFEYLAVGKAVIAPSSRGILEYFNSGSLFFFDTGDAADLARQIYEVYSHPEQARDTAIRGQMVFQAHTWPREKQALLEYVDELVGVARHC